MRKTRKRGKTRRRTRKKRRRAVTKRTRSRKLIKMRSRRKRRREKEEKSESGTHLACSPEATGFILTTTRGKQHNSALGTANKTTLALENLTETTPTNAPTCQYCENTTVTCISQMFSSQAVKACRNISEECVYSSSSTTGIAGSR